MAMAKPVRKPVRKATAKRAPARTTKKAKAKPARKVRAKPAPASSTRPETVGWTARTIRPIRRNADIPEACPICGSENLEVHKADSLAKGTAKVVASVAVPFLVVRTHPEIACRSCGWRADAADGGF